VLSAVIFLPVVVAIVLAALPAVGDRLVKRVWVATTAVELALAAALWAGYTAGRGITGGFAYVTDVRWVPSLDSGYHVGLDGLSLPLVAVTALLFLACAVYGCRETRNVRGYACLFLFLETTGIGLFSSLDLLLYFVFFDLSIVGMYFVIAGWGHEQARRAATKFFLYTFTGSLALLLGFIGLFLAASPHTFDIVTLAQEQPLAGHAAGGGLVLLALAIGLAVKTPVFPLHTWLPLAHTEAPAPGSAILAGVLLKMGTYGFVRIAMPALPGAWRAYAPIFVILGVIGVLYGALVALAQQDFKRMIAYTSVNHMGYILLAIGAAGLLGRSAAQARALAVTGAVTQMVSHALITGALFLLAGVLYDRGGTYRMDAYGGLAGRAPVFAGLTGLAAFASLGLPGFSGFVAEFQIFTGSLGGVPVATAFAILGIVVTAALLLWSLQRVFLGGEAPGVAAFTDIRPAELVAVAPLLALSIAIGVVPRFLLDVIEPAAATLAGLLGTG
jgi:NADH-quinone oxidoreductase subunit M